MAYTELLRRPLRHGVDRSDITTLRTPVEAARASRPRQERLIEVHCEGQDFHAQPEMAAIFLRRALEVLAHQRSELVPLRHTEGIELVLITPATAAACRYDGWKLTDIRRAF
jgi:hypothetical protein